MSQTDNKRYDIFFAGECLEGSDPAAVRSALGKLFKADEATLDKLFSGTRQRIKKDVDQATAAKYQRAMSSAGARVIIALGTAAVQDETTRQTADAAVESGEREHGDATAAPEDLSLAPAGSEVLRPEERAEAVEQSMDLSHLSLAPGGEFLSEPSDNPAVAIEAPDFGIAEVGSRLSSPEQGEAAQSASQLADASGLTLAPAGHDFSDCHEAVEAPAGLNIEHLALAEAGSDLLTASNSPAAAADRPAPDTSHLSLAERDNAEDDDAATRPGGDR